MLEEIRTSLPEKAEAIEAAIVRFSSLPERLPKTIVPQLFRELDETTLDHALSLAERKDPQVTEFFFSCISQRLAEQIRERIAEKPRAAEADGEAGQAALMMTLFAWAEEGRFAFKNPADAEEAA
jgi:flagellar motor switch protein FliG